MKKIIYSFTLVSLLWSCKTPANKISQIDTIQMALDLNTVKDAKLMVTVTPPVITTKKITYYVPKIIPGTYSEDDYGRFIDDFKAYDKKGNLLAVAKMDENSWIINNSKALAKITYYVNGTFDKERSHSVFSPAGTNITEGKNFLMNTHGFFGYFTAKEEIPYVINITHPTTLWGATSLDDKDPSDAKDVFKTSRYAELIDNPIMYSKPNYTRFTVDGMEILISVYSPNNVYTAESIMPSMEKMMTAQKRFLGSFNSTKKYSILLYLSDVNKNDAKGFGALEHNTSTTVVLPEAMQKNELIESLIDVVSHEFFHIVTPLNIHSKEIQYFNFNTPNMSEHLWMYEGVTEYFANLFQVNQGLITDDQFYKKIVEKITTASRFDDTMSFTKMSKNVLQKPYKDNYVNVYAKGTLIAMCIDIQIRELSNGKKGILDLMKELAKEYGNNKPFNDTELFAKITELTYPEIGTFLKTYVAGETPIPYDQYFAKVGVTFGKTKIPGNVFLKGKTPYITANPETKEIIIIPKIELNEFMNSLGVKGGDILVAIDGKKYNLDNAYEMIMISSELKEDAPISITILRDGEEIILNGKVKLTMEEADTLIATDKSKKELYEAWLRG